MENAVFTKEIIVNNKPLVFTNAVENYISKNIKAGGYLLLSGAFPRNIRLAKKHLEQLTTQGAIIHDLSDDALREMIANEFTTYKAGGGLVINEKGQLLMIFRRGNWDLPKGKLDKGEKIEDCALREVQEETGVNALQLGKKVATTYHIYEHKGKNIIKDTDWFMMQTNDTKPLLPQTEEDIAIAKWVDKKEAKLLIKQSYTIVQQLVNKYYLSTDL